MIYDRVSYYNYFRFTALYSDIVDKRKVNNVSESLVYFIKRGDHSDRPAPRLAVIKWLVSKKRSSKVAVEVRFTNQLERR